MRIGIATVYNSFNCGSFLQAYAMQETLKKEGHEPAFFRNKYRNDARLLYRLLWCAKYLCTGKKSRAKHLWRIYRNFRLAQKAFSIEGNPGKFESVVYGSDTIWNYYQAKYLTKNWKHFWGADFSGKKISYAISIGSAPVEKLAGVPFLTEQVNKFKHISVRDAATYEFVKMALKKEKEIFCVCDPTMLLTREIYENLAPEIAETGYIFFYFFSAIPDSVKKQVKAFAEKTGKKIIAFGEDWGWADQYVSNDPFLMLSYYKNADFVITNTFHGNIFALLFNKPFISFGREKEKVVDLLSQFEASDRLAETESDFSHLFDKAVDFEKVNEKISILREDSLQYLRDAFSN